MPNIKQTNSALYAYYIACKENLWREILFHKIPFNLKLM